MLGCAIKYTCKYHFEHSKMCVVFTMSGLSIIQRRGKNADKCNIDYSLSSISEYVYVKYYMKYLQ